MKETDKFILYHGSKSGIKGEIQPSSRKHCDFGSGFYMGTEPEQPLTLICNFPQACLYKLELEVRGLKILDIQVSMDWALLIAYNRGKMDRIKGSTMYQKYQHMMEGYDLVAGYIANDRMFVVLDRFFRGEITDKALIVSLSALQLGKQYVAVTKRACGNIRILEERRLQEEERKELIAKSEKNREIGIAKAEEICRKYRREGRFFDEIIGEESWL